jgi:hypothetical protein
MKQLASYEGQHCANCGASMQGEFCHECGQSIHSVLKPIHGMLEDTMDIVFHVDGRAVHTIPPLLLKPGFLTLEYFSGRRVRYIAPFRLMFVLSLLAFFVIHLQLDSLSDKIILHNHVPVISSGNDFQDAHSQTEVREQLKRQLAELDRARASLPSVAKPDMDVAEQKMRAEANQRLIALGATPTPVASHASFPTATASTTDLADATVNKRADAPGKDDDAGVTRITTMHIDWLPDVANARLNLIGQHMQANWRAFKHGDAAARQESMQRMIAGFFGVLPPTMFVLMPIFALLLKLVYVFKCRLYVEHLIVALHSHAFLFLNLLLGVLVALLAGWIRPHLGWFAQGLDWINVLLWLWAPIYLLIMQKRVYRQGWPMTVLKYLFVGWCYGWLLLFAVMIDFVLGLAH